MDLLLDLPGDAEQQQLAADPRWAAARGTIVATHRAVVPHPSARPPRAWRGARPSAWPPCSERCRRVPVAKSAPIPEATHVPGYHRAAWPQAAPPEIASSAAGLTGQLDAISRLAVLAAALLQRAALAAQAGERCPGGVRQPAGGGDQLVQRGALPPPKQARDQRLLGAGTKRDVGRLGRRPPLPVRQLAELVRDQQARPGRSAARARWRDRADRRAAQVRWRAPASLVRSRVAAWRAIARMAAALVAGLRSLPARALRMAASWAVVKSVMVVSSGWPGTDPRPPTDPSPGRQRGTGHKAERLRFRRRIQQYVAGGITYYWLSWSYTQHASLVSWRPVIAVSDAGDDRAGQGLSETATKTVMDAVKGVGGPQGKGGASS